VNRKTLRRIVGALAVACAMVSAGLVPSSAIADDVPSVTALDVAVARLDNALLAPKLPYFVDANVIRSRDRERRLVLLYEFASPTPSCTRARMGDATAPRRVSVLCAFDASTG